MSSRIVAGEESEGSDGEDVDVQAAVSKDRLLAATAPMAASGAVAGEEEESDGDAERSLNEDSDGSGHGDLNDDDDEDFDFEFMGYKTDEANRGRQRMADGILKAIKPSLHHLAFRLVELQEAQLMVCQTITREKGNLSGMPEFKQAVALITKLPEYQAKAQRIKRLMEATSALIGKVERQAAGLKDKSLEALLHHTPKADSVQFAAARAAASPKQ